MIFSVDKEEDRSCGARSWILHTGCWSLSAKEGGADGDDCRRVDDDKNDVRTRGKDYGQRCRPPARTRTKTACHRHGTGFCRSDLRNKERAGGIHPPPFTGPNNNDRQRTGDDKKESRWRTKNLEHRSGWSTMAVGCGKSKRWRARRATKEGRGSMRTQ